MQINTKAQTIREILGNGKKYCVPPFQRDYSWEREQWEDMWNDIQSIYKDEEKIHYMGYLVIQRPISNEDKFKIIDGQQRLTTFSLIILAAIKRLKEYKSDETTRINNLLKNFIIEETIAELHIINKLELNRNNNHYYREAVCGNEIPRRGNKKTVSLMRGAIDYFYDEWEKMKDAKKIGSLIEKTSDSLLFTVIDIGDDLNAYKIFETLNARGVQLSSGDLLKNYLFSLIYKNADIPDKVIDAGNEKWEKIGENIKNKSYADFVWTHWNSYHKLTRKQAIYKSIKIEINNSEKANEYFHTLSQSASLYSALLSPEDEFWRDESCPDKKKNLTFLKLFNITQPISLLMAVYKKYKKQKKDFIKILEWVKIFSLRYNIIGGGHHSRQEELYNEIVLYIQKNENIQKIKDQILRYYPNDKKFEADFTAKYIPTIQSNKRAKYILARLEEKKSDSFIDETKYTVEHLLPIRPSDEWIDYFGDNTGIYNQRIGNLFLVKNNENKKLGQKLFSDKKRLLIDTNLKINQNISEYEDWKEDDIESRQKELAKIAVNLWRID